MRSFLRRLFNRTPQTAAARRSFRPELDSLEERCVPTVVAGAIDAYSAYYVNRNHDLSYDHRDGTGADHWTSLAGSVTHVSAGKTYAANTGWTDAAFVRLTDGSLWECRNPGSASRSWVKLLNSGAAQVSASQCSADKAFVLMQNGDLYSHAGLNSQTGWTRIAGGVSKVQATQQSHNTDAAVILYNTGAVQEYAVINPGTSNQHAVVSNLASGASDISAAPLAVGSVFVLYSNGQLWRHDGFVAPYASWTKVADNVAQMAAGDSEASGTPGLVFVVDKNGGLTEYWGAKEDHHVSLASGVTSVSAVMPHGVRPGQGTFTHDEVFVELSNGSLYTGYDGYLNTPTWHRML